MKKCRRSIHAALVAVLLTAALPAAAQQALRTDKPTFTVFAKIESFIAKVWPWTQQEARLPRIERNRAIGKAGPHLEPVGSTAPIPQDQQQQNGGTLPPVL